MIQKSKNSDTQIHFFFLACIAVLVGGFLFLLKEVMAIRNQKPESAKETIIREVQKVFPTPEEAFKKVENISKPAAASKSERLTTYLNLNGTYMTNSTEWTDIKSTDTWIDIENEFGKDAYVDWDAAVKTSSSGSKVLVRLFDATNNIAVSGSDLETNSTVSVRVASGRLYLWRGHNNYRVQIKSLNGIDATFDGGRIKIVY